MKATIRQALYIERLMEERIHNYTIDPQKIDSTTASRVIEGLKQCPYKVPREVGLITPPQINLVNKLLLQKQKANEQLQLMMKMFNANELVDLTLPQAQQLIQSLLSLDPIKVNLEVGAYRLNGTFYRVYKSQTRDHLLCKRYENGEWVFDLATLYELTSENRLTLSEAAEFGVTTGCCVHCGKTLTVQKSVVAGMGAVCASKYH